MDAAKIGMISDLPRALTALANGLLTQSRNQALREALAHGVLDAEGYYAQLVCLCTRLLFMLAAEAQGLWLGAPAFPAVPQRYQRFYGLSRLAPEDVPRRPQATSAYRQLVRLLEDCGSATAKSQDGVPALGSFFHPAQAFPALQDCTLADHDLYPVVRALTTLPPGPAGLAGEALADLALALRAWQPVCQKTAGTWTFGLRPAALPTPPLPPALVTRLVHSTLDPVLDAACAQTAPETALLQLKLGDPACGHGTFLRAAAQHLAERLATLRTGQPVAPSEVLRQARYEVMQHCLYGVDLHAAAVDVCRLSLALDSLCPGATFEALVHHIRWGDSLLGATPTLLAQGIPEAAFARRPGDDKAVATALRKRNHLERLGQLAMEFAGPESAPLVVPQASEPSCAATDLCADAWCAAFLWPKTRDAAPAVTHHVFYRLQHTPTQVPAATRAMITQLAVQHRFLHWHLAFPEVFTLSPAEKADAPAGPGWQEGFDVLLGKPPWQARPSAQTASLLGYLARYHSPATRGLHVTALFIETARRLLRPHGRLGFVIPTPLLLSQPALFERLLREEALCSLYTIANDLRLLPHLPRTTAVSLLTLAGTGHRQDGADIVWGIRQLEALDEATGHLTLHAADLALLHPNTHAWPLWRTASEAAFTRAIAHRMPILRAQPEGADAGWGAQAMTMLQLTRDAALLRTRQELEHAGWRLHGEVFRRGQAISLPVYEAAMLRPLGTLAPLSTPQCWIAPEHIMQAVASLPPVFLHAYRRRRADDLLKVLAAWLAGYHLNQGHQTCTRETLSQVYNPMFQALAPTPGAWVAAPELAREWPLTPGDLLLIKRQRDILTLARQLAEKHTPGWFLTWRERIFAAPRIVLTIVPRVGLAHTCPILRLSTTDARLTSCLVANMHSLVVDFCVRHKLPGRRLTAAVLYQLPTVPLSAYLAACPWDQAIALRDWIAPRLLELLYTSVDLAAFAHDWGYDGAVFAPDATRRLRIRSELEAAYALLYGLTLPELMTVLATCLPGTSPSTAPEPEAALAAAICECYERLQACTRSAVPYDSPLDPLPADPRLATMVRHARPGHEVVPGLRQVDPGEADKYKTCVPLFELQTVASAFAEGEDVEPETWLGVPPGRTLRPGMFVAQMVGPAMEPHIPEGAYCLFERQRDDRTSALQGRIVLAQHHDLYDPDTGGNYTVRRYAQEPSSGTRRARQAPLIRLLPVHPAYDPMVLEPRAVGERYVIATLLAVLDPHMLES